VVACCDLLAKHVLREHETVTELAVLRPRAVLVFLLYVVFGAYRQLISADGDVDFIRFKAGQIGAEHVLLVLVFQVVHAVPYWYITVIPESLPHVAYLLPELRDGVGALLSRCQVLLSPPRN